MKSDKLFEGPDRIEHSEALGRPIRSGSLTHLSVSDYRRVEEALLAHDAKTAQTYLEALHPMYSAMNSTFLEWCFSLPAIAAKYCEQEAKITKDSSHAWSKNYSQDSSASLLMRTFFSSLSVDTITEFRAKQKKGESNQATLLLEQPQKMFIELVELIKHNNFEKASALFSEYFDQMRLRHDLLGGFVSTFGTVMEKKTNQELTARTLHEALDSCPLVGGMWEIIKKLDPKTLAALLAEHLRGHFSGEGRKGAVEIVEEKDRFRLIFDPCGSGGALRRQGTVSTFPKAAAETWQRAGQVPPYCSHCALNELQSISRLGYLAWVTEFNPDPTAPCGWTVYKNPQQIPEHYYTRIGHKKPDN